MVRYKNYNYQDGPTHVIKKSDIASIIYQNGEVEVFSQQKEAETIKAEQAQTPKGEPVKEASATDYHYFKSLSDDDDMSDFLQKNDPEGSYRYFRNGEKLSSTGKKLMIPGIVLTGVGGIAWITSYIVFNQTGYDENGLYLDNTAVWWMIPTGAAIFAIGQTCLLASIPLQAVGGVLKERGKRNYEGKYFKGQATALNLDIHPTGIGLRLRF